MLVSASNLHWYKLPMQPWNPSDLYKIDMPEPLREKQKEKAIKQAKKLLLSEWIISESQLVS